MGPRFAGYPAVFLGLNLLMATIPVAAALWLESKTRGRRWGALPASGKVLVLLVAALWLWTMPHTAYVATLVRHLRDSAESPLTSVVLAFVAAALVGLGAFHLALSRMRRVAASLVSPSAGRVVPWMVVPLVAFGVRLGVDRVDSWDVVARPARAWAVTARTLTSPEAWLDVVVTTAILLLVFFGIDRLWHQERG